MPTCRKCNFSQNAGCFIGGFCENCQKEEFRKLLNEISNYQREEVILKEQLQKEKDKYANYLAQRKAQIQAEINLIKEVLND